MAPLWRIYYSDGSTFSSLDGEPHEAPPRGFVCAVGYRQNGKRYIMHLWDHYFWHKGVEQWWGCDIHGLIDRLCMNEVYAYKLGRTCDCDTYNHLMDRADKDPDFPVGGRE